MSNAKRITDLATDMKLITEYHMDYGSSEEKAIRLALAAERGFKQEDSFHIARLYPTIEMSMDGKDLQMVLRKYYEPVDLLSNSVDTIHVNISTGVRSWMQKAGKRSYKIVMRFARTYMAEQSDYKHIIAARKSKLFFSKLRFEDHPWAAHFARFTELYRNEALAVALGARGITVRGNTINTPEKIVDKVADGVIMLLKKSTGARLGYYPGMWQIRSIFPFTKGLMIIWGDDSCVEYFNTDVMKVKRKENGSTICEPIPDTFSSDQIVAISNSDDLYTMRFSHQAGYLLQNTRKSKGGAWGIIPQLIANALVRDIKDKQGVDQVNGYQVDRVAIEELMPDYIRMLQSAGFPRQYLGTVNQINAAATQASIAKAEAAGIEPETIIQFKSAGKDILDTVMLAARPTLGRMGMFAALTPESTGMKVGWYKPASNLSAGPGVLSDHVARVPFMAHGGGIQKVKWAGDSPLMNTIMAIVESITPDEQEKFDAAASKGEKYTRKDSPESAAIWKQVSAMGADSDGDRLIILTQQGLKYMKTAGLYINENPEGFKAKNQYPGLDSWSSDMVAAFWEVSTPRLGEVGKGDTITRDALDAYKSGMFDWKTYYKFALHGAGQVQVGVSAPKYYFNNPYFNLSPMQHAELRELMEEEGIGAGRKFEGLLWDEAREKAQGMILEFLPETMEIVALEKGVHRKNWKGATTDFHATLRGYNPEQGVDWPTTVRNAFFKQLTLHGITAGDVRKGLKGENALMVHKLIREYIYNYPHRINIWCWFLDERLTGVTKDGILKVIGLPFEEKPERE